MDTAQLYNLFKKHPVVTNDTRNIPCGSIYFALHGERFDGNAFATEALAKGAAYAVIDKKEFMSGPKTILVPDALAALQNLANLHRRTINIPIIAITGTNGKTTTKELIHAVLSQKYAVRSTAGNLNNHIGVPLTLLSMTSETGIGVVEMGANHRNEINQLCNIAEPTHGLITNIGKAHLGGFGGFEGVISAKNELYQYLINHNGIVFYNSDNELLTRLTGNYTKKVAYGIQTGNNCRGTIHVNEPFLTIKAGRVEEGKIVEEYFIDSQLFGSYNAENILAACSVGIFFKIPVKVIANAIAAYSPNNNRSQIKETGKNKLFLDCYNANPSSTVVALKAFGEVTAHRKTIILGDMLELGDETREEHKKILDITNSCKDCTVFAVGPFYKELAANYNILSFDTSDELRDWINEHPITDNFVLIKGSRGIHLEKVIDVL